MTMNRLEIFMENREKYAKYDYPRVFIPDIKSKALPTGKTCGSCWNFINGIRCGDIGKTAKDTNYCGWPVNYFSESERKIELPKYSAPKVVTNLDFFQGTQEELVLHEILERANYQCECEGVLCDKHGKDRCKILHKKRGGDTIFLLQPKNPKMSHSLENTQAYCVACANASTISRMNILKNKRKPKTISGQQSII